jgi:hypothetical protein
VIGCPDAILKKDVDACGGCVIVSPPAGAVAGMDKCDAVGVAELLPPLPFAAVLEVPALLPPLELFPFVGLALVAVFVFGGWFAFDMTGAAAEEGAENAERDDSDDGKATPRRPAAVARGSGRHLTSCLNPAHALSILPPFVLHHAHPHDLQ